MNKLKIFFLLIVLIFTSRYGFAQIQLNGSFDVGLRAGGENSSFVKNGIESDFKYLHFRIPQVNLFLFAPINETFFFEARLQSDTWGVGELKNPYFTLANITWSDPQKDFSITAGRFVSPVGFYSERSLLLDRSFHDLPLNYSYFINISDQRGFWPLAGVGGSYTSSDVGLTTIYFGGYATGGLFDWQIKEDKARLQLGLTSVAPASAQNYTNLANAALLGRLTLNPSIKWQVGFTGSYGSFMREGTINSASRPFNPLERYRQTIVGADVKYGLGYWEVIAEAIYSHWFVPVFVDNGFETVGATNKFQEDDFANVGTNLDIRFEAPSLVGSFLAVRFDNLIFLNDFKFENPEYDVNQPDTEPEFIFRKWDQNVKRISLAFGYKLGRNVEAKLSFSEQTPFDGSLYTFRTTISTFF